MNDDLAPYRAKIKEMLLGRGAIRRGDFTLSSGEKSKVYINCKDALFSGHFLQLVAHCFCDLTSSLPPRIDVVGGMGLGAVPIACSIVMRYRDLYPNWNVEGFSVRSEHKGHGTRSRIEGLIGLGMQCLIVEDVVTTGTSVFDAIRTVKKAGGKIHSVLSLIDRDQGGREVLKEFGYRWLFGIEDLITPESFPYLCNKAVRCEACGHEHFEWISCYAVARKRAGLT